MLQPLRAGDSGSGNHGDIDPEATIEQDKVIAIRMNQTAGTWTQRMLQFVDGLAQRSPRLLLGTLAPQQPGEVAAEHRLRRRQSQNCQHRPCLAGSRQNALPCRILGLHLAEQPQAQQRIGDRRANWVVRGNGPHVCDSDTLPPGETCQRLQPTGELIVENARGDGLIVQG